MQVERSDSPWQRGSALFAVHWQPPRGAATGQAPQRRSTHVRISKERNYLEVGSAAAQFIDIKRKAVAPDGTVEFDINGRGLGRDEAITACLHHILGPTGRNWI